MYRQLPFNENCRCSRFIIIISLNRFFKQRLAYSRHSVNKRELNSKQPIEAAEGKCGRGLDRDTRPESVSLG